MSIRTGSSAPWSSGRAPPTRSAAFSRSASQRAASLEAPCSDNTYTEAPVTLRSRIESACTEMNMSACARWARPMRSCSSRNSSRSRVSTACIPGSVLSALASARAMASVTSFSRVPPWPMAPGSTPPCPASTAMMTSRSPSAGACVADKARGGASASNVPADVDASPSVTRSCRDPAPAPQVLRAESADRSCRTTRSVPRGCAPTRTAVTMPLAADAWKSAARCVLGRSRTTRGGLSRVKSFWAASPLKSRVTCAASVPAASVMARNSAPAVACAAPRAPKPVRPMRMVSRKISLIIEFAIQLSA